MQVGIGGPQTPSGVDMDIVMTAGSSQLGGGVYVGYTPLFNSCSSAATSISSTSVYQAAVSGEWVRVLALEPESWPWASYLAFPKLL